MEKERRRRRRRLYHNSFASHCMGFDIDEDALLYSISIGPQVT